MRYNLATIATGTRRKRIVLRPIDPPATLAAPLKAEGDRIITETRQAVAEALLPLYVPRPTITTDNTADILTGAIAAVREVGRRLVATIGGGISRWGVRVENWHRPRFAASVKAGAGVDIAALLTSADAEDQVQAALRWATSLITNVEEDLLDTIESRVWAGYASQTPRRELAKQLAGDMQIARKRAEKIAIDQTTKLASNLDQMRSLEAGLAKYDWMHSGKTHFRPEHLARNGKTFEWAKPPADGHPGQAIFCGCRAMPVLDLDD